MSNSACLQEQGSYHQVDHQNILSAHVQDCTQIGKDISSITAITTLLKQKFAIVLRIILQHPVIMKGGIKMQNSLARSSILAYLCRCAFNHSCTCTIATDICIYILQGNSKLQHNLKCNLCLLLSK